MTASTETRMDVVGLGYCAYDILTITPRLPAFDDVEMVHVGDLVWDGGGPVSTALTALARLGAWTGYVGLLGDDREGRWLGGCFRREGVDVARLRFGDRVGTNVCLILVEQGSGRRSILCHQRVEAHDLILDDTDRHYIQSARVLHLDGQFLPAAIQAAATHLDDPQAAARELLAQGPELLIVTQGERGCQVWTPEEHFQVPAFPVEVVDTTGAGDAFHGGFLYAMLQGWDLRRVALFANAVASLNCQTLGGQRGLPTLTRVEELLETAP